MSPKIKSALSAVVLLVVLFGFFFYRNLAALVGVTMSPIGSISSFLMVILIPYVLYRIFLKIYS